MTHPRGCLILAGVLLALVLASCGGGGGGVSPVESAPQRNVSTYLGDLPPWDQYSPPAATVPPTRVGTPAQSSEQIENVPVIDPVDNGILGYRSEMYQCTTTRFSMADTPEKIVMFSPDREILWPGSLIQGRSHRDGIGSLQPLTIVERTPIKVSIPSLATEDNYRLVLTPDQAVVNQAIGSMISNATTSNLVTPSTIQFFMEDFSSEEAFALSVGVSGKYMGFRASASSSVSRSANERTVMVYFYEKMFEVVVEPPQTPGAFFSDSFSQAKLDEQVRLGKIGPENPPLYVSNVVYGRMMAFTFTSTASSSEIKAALNAAYKGIFASVSANVSAQHKKVLEEGKISVTSLGGQAKATEAMIASGDWRQYFTESAPLTSAYPISYTFRNLRDGSIAKVSESTQYDIKECSLRDAAFTGFVLDSFETENDFDEWQSSQPPVAMTWGAPETPQSIFYGYVYAQHTNTLTADNRFLYDVGYLLAPPHFQGVKNDFYRGELTFWYKPDDVIHSATAGTFCYDRWILWPFVKTTVCVPNLVQTNQALAADDKVYTYDNVTSFDQVVLRGGTPPYSVLTLAYNPKKNEIDPGWSRQEISLTNDNAVNSECDPADPSKKGCWLVEDEIATEDEIKYVLANILDFRIRASYPVQRSICLDDPPPAPGAACIDRVLAPFGYVGGYFDEVKLNKKSAGF